MEAKVKWITNMQFIGKADSSHGVLLDVSSKVGGENTASAPMELLLIALGGCTGMDTVSILKKMRVEFNSLEIEIKAERVPEHPRVFRNIELVYKVRGRDIPEDNVKKAVNLSQEKYCSISAMLKSTAEIKYAIEIKNEN